MVLHAFFLGVSLRLGAFAVKVLGVALNGRWLQDQRKA